MMSYYIFWISLAFLIYIYVGYLGISMLLGKLFRRPFIKKDISPSVTLIIPAFNEQKVIKEKIENSLGLDYPKEKLEIVIASESNDGTNNIASQYIEKGIVLYTYKARQGKSKLLYDTLPKIKGEIIVFSDANAIYKKDALKKLVRNFHDRRIGAALGRLVISNPHDSSTTEGESLYKKYEGLLRKHNSYLHAILGVDGSMFAIRRELYLPITPTRGDDFELAARIRIKGFGIVFEEEAISYEKAPISSHDEIKRKIRIVSGFLRSSIFLLKEMLRPFRGLLIFQLVSNKILRWASPYFLIIFFFSNMVLFMHKRHGFYDILFSAQILFYLMALLSGIYLKKNKGPLFGVSRIPFYFLSFNYAFLLGTLKGLFLKAPTFWEKVRE
jgi:cellulose synthase/poly-beta-1,6-N-acetylglucosamine synthase-like glycosyltransferase